MTLAQYGTIIIVIVIMVIMSYCHFTLL